MKHSDLRQMLGVPGISPGAQSVLLALAIRTDLKNTCFPTVACIQSDTGLSRASVLRHIKELEVKLLIGVVPRPKKSSIYEVRVGVIKSHTDTYHADTGQSETGKQSSGITQTHEGSHTETQNKNSEVGSKIEVGNSANSAGENQMKVADIVSQHQEVEPDDYIVARKNLESVFRRSWMKYLPSNQLPEFKVKERSQLKQFAGLVGKDKAPLVILTCIKYWMAFNVYAQDKFNKGVGLMPSPGALLLAATAAINFTEKVESEEFADTNAGF